jgi:hypothetical protein
VATRWGGLVIVVALGLLPGPAAARPVYDEAALAPEALTRWTSDGEVCLLRRSCSPVPAFCLMDRCDVRDEPQICFVQRGKDWPPSFDDAEPCARPRVRASSR